jgi:riboflavin kinase/FMN adenylyltransferase
VDAEIRYGITNVVLRPTVNNDILCAETHIFDFDGDLYGKEITVEFLHFLRAETKFESVELLTKQVENDITKAKEYISKITE